jgi:hypothetical protein
VQETTAPLLAAWESYYVIVGSSGAALTGLMFVVITLINDSARRRTEAAIAAFSTPTIIHFGAALLVSAIISAPWKTLGPVGLTIGLGGVASLIYITIVIARMFKVSVYKPVLEDWMFHAVLPAISYLTLLGSAVSLARHPEASLFAIGGATLLLLFIGIHNAWDTVTFLVLSPESPNRQPPPQSAAPTGPAPPNAS